MLEIRGIQVNKVAVVEVILWGEVLNLSQREIEEEDYYETLTIRHLGYSQDSIV